MLLAFLGDLDRVVSIHAPVQGAILSILIDLQIWSYGLDIANILKLAGLFDPAVMVVLQLHTISWLMVSRNYQCFAGHLTSASLSEQRSIGINAGFGSAMLDTLLPVSSQVVVAKTVFSRINCLLQPFLAFGPLGRIDFEFKDGILHSLTEVKRDFCHAAESLLPDSRQSAYIICHQHVH